MTESEENHSNEARTTGPAAPTRVIPDSEEEQSNETSTTDSAASAPAMAT
eukprot:CAMPEP_0117442842 /NCGR_PEP_ID=MMETSP0759-20121206/4370_1 /TAXON_ID=63605 /ORGANISM="Percolomonas cosmopolitus, Strain WS" /LENGTH=49 /DNA_ID= /DNA_START= /DNA_END= /DNA_ORIENTATION=